MNIGKKATQATEVRDHVIDALRTELVGPSPGYPMVQLNGEEILRPRDPRGIDTLAASCSRTASHILDPSTRRRKLPA
jgi:hypothetical protein